uniref:Gustatory receptor n=1 Tax=Tetranychus urticae TaxID=32264 RepID=T1KM57_TETUR
MIQSDRQKFIGTTDSKTIPIINFYIDNVYGKTKRVKLLWNFVLAICLIFRVHGSYKHFSQKPIKVVGFLPIEMINALLSDLSHIYLLCSHQWVFRSTNIEPIYNLWSSIGLPSNKVNLNYVSSRRKKSLICFMILIGLLFYNETPISLKTRYSSALCNLIHNTISLFIRYCSVAISCSVHGPFLIELAIVISAAFNHVNLLISKLDETNLSQLAEIRRLHSQIIILSRKCNSLFSFFIPFAFPIQLFKIINIFYLLLFDPISQNNINLNTLDIVNSFIGPIYLGFTVFRLMEVYTSSIACSDSLYALSHRIQSPETQYEIVLFIFRVDKKDIGFKFWRLAIIGPNFFSSLTIIMIPLIISLPILKANPFQYF